MARYLMKYFFVLILLLVFIYNALILYIDENIEKRNHKNVYKKCSKVWSSRGVYNSFYEQNSISSFQKAFDEGHMGVEVDFYYDVKMNKFIVSHDRIHKDTEGDFIYFLKDGKLLTLEKVFEKFGKKYYFWLDYKNLDRLTTEETLSAIKRLNVITQNSNIREKLYLEGSTPNTLEMYTKAGYKTLFAFQPLKADSIFSSISSNIYKIAYYFYDITAIAISYGPVDNPKYSEQSQENLKGIPTFLFHVPNEEKLLKKLVKHKNIRVMLVGRDESVNRADIKNCDKEN